MSQKEFIFTPFKVIQVECNGTEIPRPRSGHRIVCDDIFIYCFGGYNPYLPLHTVQTVNPTWSPDKPLFRELWSYSIAKQKWKQHKVVKNMPEELASNAMCLHGRNLLIFGGTGAPFGIKCSNDVIVWKTGSDDAELNLLDATGNRPPGQYGQAVFCYKNHFYAIGGTNGFAYNCDIYRLDLETLIWECIYVGVGQDNEPLGRYRHEVIRVNDKLYIIGGGTGDWAFELMEIPVFDLETRTWSVLAPKADESSHKLAPLPRKCHTAVTIKTETGLQVFVVGGTDGQSVFEDIWRLDINTLQWTLMQKTILPSPIYFHSATVTTSGCMFIFGGIEPREEPAGRNNTMYKVWLCIPKLSEICWEALLHYRKDLTECDRHSLLCSGIPSHLVERAIQ